MQQLVPVLLSHNFCKEEWVWATFHYIKFHERPFISSVSMLVKAQQGSLGAGIWRGEKSSYQYFMLRSKQTMFLLPWCLKKTIYSKGISNTVVTYFNCNLTKRPRGQGIILSSFYWEGKSVTIFPPTNRRETFLILQIGLCSSHVFNEKSSGFQLSTVDYSDLGVALNGMGRCSFWKHFIPAPTSCDCETNPPRLHQNAPTKHLC